MIPIEFSILLVFLLWVFLVDLADQGRTRKKYNLPKPPKPVKPTMFKKSTLVIEPKCGYCRSIIQVWKNTCISCETPHHEECWLEMAGCSVYGCSNSKSKQQGK